MPPKKDKKAAKKDDSKEEGKYFEDILFSRTSSNGTHRVDL